VISLTLVTASSFHALNSLAPRANFNGDALGGVQVTGRAFGQQLDPVVPDGQQAGAEPVLPRAQHRGDLLDVVGAIARHPAQRRRWSRCSHRWRSDWG
jgi:hypothetical protein